MNRFGLGEFDGVDDEVVEHLFWSEKNPRWTAEAWVSYYEFVGAGPAGHDWKNWPQEKWDEWAEYLGGPPIGDDGLAIGSFAEEDKE